MNELVPSSQLDHEFGGDYNFLYDYETYWKTITEFCRLVCYNIMGFSLAMAEEVLGS